MVIQVLLRVVVICITSCSISKSNCILFKYIYIYISDITIQKFTVPSQTCMHSSDIIITWSILLITYTLRGTILSTSIMSLVISRGCVCCYRAKWYTSAQLLMYHRDHTFYLCHFYFIKDCKRKRRNVLEIPQHFRVSRIHINCKN